MTKEQVLTLLGPLLAALVLAAASIVTAIATGIVARIKIYLDAKGQAEASKVLSDASDRMQAAMANEAGVIALEVGAGHLDLTDLVAVKARALQGEAAVLAKLPQAAELLQPLTGAIANGIAGKVLAAGAPVAAASATAVLDALTGLRRDLVQQRAAA